MLWDTAQALLPAVFRLPLNHSVTPPRSFLIQYCSRQLLEGEEERRVTHLQATVEISGLYKTYYRGKY